MTEKTYGRYQITRVGPSHSRFELKDEGKAIYGQIPPDAVMVNYSAGKRPTDRNTILLTEEEHAKLSHMGLVRILDGGTLAVTSAVSGVTAQAAATVHADAAKANAAAKARDKAGAKKATAEAPKSEG